MNKARVMVVDDDSDLLQMLTIRLRRGGYEVAAEVDGNAALDRAAVFRPHVVITDLKMDRMDGMQLLERLKQTQPAVPVIMLTAHGTIPDAVEATRRGVFAFLTKPFDPEALLAQTDKAAQVAGSISSEPTASIDADWCADIVTRSPAMEEVLKQAKLAARSDVNIIIQSQSGTGKELLAKAIHRASPRGARAFVAVNCTAIPEALFESELFGHKKGSFTGATSDREGLVRAAHGGTLFLDEIGDMPLHFQAKLLRTIQEREVRPVGSHAAAAVDVRIIAATHQNLEAAVADGRFREDLYYRLNVVVLELPTLAQRREDIPLLCEKFLSLAGNGRADRVFSPEAKAKLMAAPWPGNVRQLQNVVEQCVVLSDAPMIPASLVERALRGKSGKLLPLSEARDRFEREYLVDLLRITEGNVTLASKLAERNRSEFYKLLGRHGLDPQMFRAVGAAPGTP
jgi:two-component system, NtrC family, response regulator GlrR